MPTKYFWKNTTDDTECDPGWTMFDLSETQGSSTPQVSDNTQNDVGFEPILTWQILPSDTVTGPHDLSADITAASPASEFGYKLSIDRNVSAACARLPVSGSQQTGTGIKTQALGSIPAPTHLYRTLIEGKRLSGHGNKNLTLNVNDADTFVDVPWPLSEIESPLIMAPYQPA